MAEENVTPITNKRYPTLPRLKVTRSGRIKEPGATYQSVNDVLKNTRKMLRLDQEQFWVLHLNAKNQLIGYEVISAGSLTASIVHPREVFKGAILNGSAAIVCCHNHPSGDPTPSSEDDIITARLRRGADLLGIRLLDHVIIGLKKYYSYSDNGKIN
ncbi:MAG: JAB domain-containing protein [Salinivirgaceae bacterium]|nr:JAB domain-containing protein [Salinivirgaceae bacterium]